MTTKPQYKVAHLRRTYLLRREPFIGYQVTSHVDFEPIVLCRERDKTGGYDTIPIFCSEEQLRGTKKHVADLMYQRMRMLSQWELDYLTDVLRTERPDLLHCHYLPDARFFLDLKRRSGLPMVVSSYGYDTLEFPRRFYGLGARYLAPVFRDVDWFLAMSPDMRIDLIKAGCPAEKIRIHYYGVEVSEFSYPGRVYADRGVVTLLIVAGLDEYKGHIYLLNAMRELARSLQQQKIELRIIGKGPLENELREFVKKNGLEGVVKFLGFVPHLGGGLADEYKRADIFVLPSVVEADGTKEGIPGALVEAMASGLPSVATRHAGIPYVVDDGGTGILVGERNVDELSRALKSLCDSSELRARIGGAASKKAHSLYDYRVKMLELESIYLQSIGSQRGNV